jgi:arsenite-transporting ATPase
MRIIVFSGKGGSGASTIAAGTACLLADKGARTLAFALDRGIGAALDVHLDLDPATVIDNLDGVEGHGGLAARDEFREWLHRLLAFRNMDPELSDDLATLPGINHIGRLLELERLLDSRDYDAAVLDAATLSQFLDLPSALDSAARWLDRLFARRQQTVFEPFLRAFAGDYADRGEEVFESGREMLGRLAALRDLLTDPDVTSVRLVGTADRSAVDELRDALSVLALFSFRVDAMIAGRLLPDEVDAPFFAGQREEQKAALEAIHALAPAPPLLRANVQSTVPRGPEALRAFVRGVYGAHDPAAFLAPSDEHSVAKEERGYLLRVFLPFARREDLRLEEVDGGIAVHLNGRRCILTLPEDVSYRSAASWSYEEHELRVVLER